MPTHPPLDPALCHDYPAPKKYVLVLSCVDARLLDDLVCFLDGDNLTNRYYHLTLPGTALGLSERIKEDTSDPALLAQFARWRQTFIDEVQASVILTQGQISDIYIVQHEDCGAFRVYLGKDPDVLDDLDEFKMHRDYACALAGEITAEFDAVYNPRDKSGQLIQKRPPNVRSFFMDLRGHVKCLACAAPATPAQPAEPKAVKPSKKAALPAKTSRRR